MNAPLPQRRARIRVLAGVLLALSAGAHGAVFSLNPTQDAFVTTGPIGNLVGTNYGAAGALALAAPGSVKGEFQSVLQFNLAAARSAFDSQYGPGAWALQSVALTLTAAAPNNSLFNATRAGQFGASWMQNDSWLEGTGSPTTARADGITFSSLANSFIGPADEMLGSFSFNGATNGSATYTLALTPGFAADVLAGNAVSLRLFGADSVVGYLFDSENFPTASSRPVLTVTAVPEPGTGTLALTGTAIVGVVGSCGRKLRK